MWLSKRIFSSRCYSTRTNHLLMDPLMNRTDSGKTAVVDGTDFSYGQLLKNIGGLRSQIKPFQKSTVAFLFPPSYDYTVVFYTLMSLGCVAVPLAISHPPMELNYTMKDSESNLVIYHPMFREKIQAATKDLNIKTLELEKLTLGQEETDSMDPKDRALFIYTSGTTGKPKGAVHTLSSVHANVDSLIKAWDWKDSDKLLHLLPLHHVHGLVNCLLCPIHAGATVEFQPWDAAKVWQRLTNGDITVFMGVPTMYSKLVQSYESSPPSEQEKLSKAVQQLRLQVSGSAPLPETLFDSWKNISKTNLLERYGMTEIGMALGNPLQGPRVKGTVGVPFPNVEVKLVDPDTQITVDIPMPNTKPPHLPEMQEKSGEIWIKGPNVFLEYHNRPEATAETFSGEWFKTGDIGTLVPIDVGGKWQGYYKILGRASQDIIKSSGYKISAIEIEREILDHPNVSDAAVVGIPDEQYGERVAAVIVLKKDLSVKELQDFLKDRLAPYKVPNKVIVLKEMPRNAMGKVVKKELKKLF